MAESNLQDTAFFPPDDSFLRIPCPHCDADPARRPSDVRQEILDGQVVTVGFRCMICGGQPYVLVTDHIISQLHAVGVHGPTVLMARGIPTEGVLVSWCPGTGSLSESLDDELTLHLD